MSDSTTTGSGETQAPLSPDGRTPEERAADGSADQMTRQARVQSHMLSGAAALFDAHGAMDANGHPIPPSKHDD